MTPNPAKAPWYFLWLQEIVTDTTIHIGSFTINGAFVGGVILPGLLIDAADGVAVARPEPGGGGGTCGSRESRRTQNLVFLRHRVPRARVTVIGMFMRGPYWHFYWPWEAWPDIPARI